MLKVVYKRSKRIDEIKELAEQIMRADRDRKKKHKARKR